jgi:small subunit ribosomal protein S20
MLGLLLYTKIDPEGRNTMAQHKSAIKRYKQSLRNRAANRSYKATMKTAAKKAVGLAAAEGKTEQSLEAMKTAVSLIAKAAQRGIMHRNASRRKISKLMRTMNGTKQASAS